MNDPRSKVFGVGWARTGTTTLGTALSVLGYHHQSQRLDLVSDVMAGDLSRIMALADRRDSFEDWPWALLYRELDERFPGSRFVLTRRRPERWLASYRRMLDRLPPASPQLIEIRRFLYGPSFPEVADRQLLGRYEAHNAAVRRYFAGRRGDLLMVDWEAGHGWHELCDFLKRPVPDRPFPHEHRTS